MKEQRYVMLRPDGTYASGLSSKEVCRLGAGPCKVSYGYRFIPENEVIPVLHASYTETTEEAMDRFIDEFNRNKV